MKLALVRDLFFVWYTAQDASESVLLTFPSVVGPGSVVLECDFTGSIRGGGRQKLAVPHLWKNPKNVLPEQPGISMNLYVNVCNMFIYDIMLYDVI
jgi:hypothetical protein